MIQNFLAILVKFGSTFLFVLLELFCLFLIVNNNSDQQAIWLNSSNIFTGSIYNQYNKFTSFISLSEENDKLAIENAALRSQLLERNWRDKNQDSLVANNFEFIPAVVINNAVKNLNNKITLNKGSNEGIKKGMGVISRNGIVGVVSHVSSEFCTVNSILNIQTNVSGIVARTKTLGDLAWEGKSPAFLNMNSIPQYVPLLIGDTITTSGFSTIFPKGHLVGSISSIDKNSRTGYFDIDVRLSNDLASIEYVYIIKNIIYETIEEFQEETENE